MSCWVLTPSEAIIIVQQRGDSLADGESNVKIHTRPCPSIPFPPVQRNLSELIPLFEEMPKECQFSLATLRHHVEDCGCLQEKDTHYEKCNLRVIKRKHFGFL